MKQLGFFFDASRCTGCRTCQVACKDKNNLAVGCNFRHVIDYEGGTWKQNPQTGAWNTDTFAYYISMSCNQCSDPACVKVCPVKAHKKDAATGLVTIDRATCIGCGMCAAACPYGAPKLDTKTRKMTKCDACVDRLAKGQNPACVDACPQRALEFGDIEELKRRHPDTRHIAPLPDPKATRPNLLIKAPRCGKSVGSKEGQVYGADSTLKLG